MKIHERNTKCHSNLKYLNNLNQCSDITITEQIVDNFITFLYWAIMSFVF